MQIRDIRDSKFKPDDMANLTVLETLKHHKQWGDGTKYQDQKFGKYEAEHIKDFYVMHQKEDPGAKNDIKMHICIDPTQANDAMRVIHQLVTSEKYAGLINEYKIGDIAYIEKRNQDNLKTLREKLTQLLPGVNADELIKELKEKYPDVNDIIAREKAKVPQEQQANVESSLQQLCSNELGAIISGERILHEALFTVYFNQDITDDLLRDFCQDVNQQMNENNVKPGKIAKTDGRVNDFCGVTIDHIVDPSTGQKKYLEGSKPEDVERRQKALRDNPLTSKIVPIVSTEQALKTMAKHTDEKDGSGMSAFTARGLNEIPLEQRIAFSSRLVGERFKQTDNVNLVYRNPEMFAKWVVKETLNEIGFPVPTDKKGEFFALVERAISTPPDQAAKDELKQFFSDPDKNRQVTQMLAPFYKQYMDSVKIQFAAQNMGKYPNSLEYNDELGKRMNEAKKQFMGHVSFPFVESLVFELEEKDGFTPSMKGKLAAGFRTLREQGMMDELQKTLDKSYEGDHEYQPSSLNDNTTNKAFEIYEKGSREYLDLKTHHETTMEPVRVRTTELYKMVNKIASSLPKDSEIRATFESLAGSIENVKTELDHKLLRGEKISPEDVQKVYEQFNTIMARVKNSLNEPNPRGETPLHEAVRTGNKELVEVLLKAGSNPMLETTHYKRGFMGTIKDFFNGKGLDTPPRTATQLARHLGQQELVELLEAKELEFNNPQTEMTQMLAETLNEQVDVKVDEKIDVEPQVEVNPIGNVFQIHRVEAKQSENEVSNFVAGWIRVLKEEIKFEEARIAKNETDMGFDYKQPSRNIFALKRALNYLEARPNLDPNQNTTDRDNLRVITGRIREDINPPPFRIEKLLTDLDAGFIPPNVRPVPRNIDGKKSEFVRDWQVCLTRLMESGAKPKPLLDELISCLERNKAMKPENKEDFAIALKQVDVVIKRNEEQGMKLDPAVEEALAGLREGAVPVDEQKSQFKKN